MFKFLQSKRSDPNAHPGLDSEKKFDRSGKSDYRMSGSVAVAVDFFFSALHGKLPPEQQALIDIHPGYLKDWLCDFVSPGEIRSNNDEYGCYRKVFFWGQNATAPSFRVELRKRPHSNWKVVGFEYFRVDGAFCAVFEPYYRSDGYGRWVYESIFKKDNLSVNVNG